MRDVTRDIPPGSRGWSAGEPPRPIPNRDGAPARSHPFTPFGRRVSEPNVSLLVDDILTPGVLLEFVSVDVLNCYINYVDLRAVITERDPEEEERHISISNRFYTHFHEFGTVIHVLASSERHWWYFCYDIDASDCAIGRVEIERATAQQMREWVLEKKVSKRYPVVEIDVKNLQGWRSFQ